MSRRTAIVCTTNFEPAFLSGYLQSLRRFSRDKATSLIIIGGKKTPASIAAASRFSLKVHTEGRLSVYRSMIENRMTEKAGVSP